MQAVLEPRHCAEHHTGPLAQELVFAAARAPDENRGVVTRVYERHLASLKVDDAHPRSHEHIGVVVPAERVVYAGHDFVERKARLGLSLYGGLGAHHEKRRRHALPADVRHKESDCRRRREEEVVEVAAYVARGMHRGEDIHSSLVDKRGEDPGNRVLLDVGRHRHVLGHALAHALLCKAREDYSRKYRGKHEGDAVDNGRCGNQKPAFHDGRMAREDDIHREALDNSLLPVEVIRRLGPDAPFAAFVGMGDHRAVAGRYVYAAVFAAHMPVVRNAGDGRAREVAYALLPRPNLYEAAVRQPDADILDHLAAQRIRHEGLGKFRLAVEKHDEFVRLALVRAEVESPDLLAPCAVGKVTFGVGHAYLVDAKIVRQGAQTAARLVRVVPPRFLAHLVVPVARKHRLADHPNVHTPSNVRADVVEHLFKKLPPFTVGDMAMQYPVERHRRDKRRHDGRQKP